MRLFGFLFILSLLIFSCSLSARQERTLNKSLGLYVQAIQNKTILVEVSMTHPCFLKHINSKGNEYFTYFFQNNPEEEEMLFFEPRINKIETKGDLIHVLYSIQKEFIYKGNNKKDSASFVAITEDDGENWFFVRKGMYSNEKICTDVPRLLK
jgi:hypothetical protein